MNNRTSKSSRYFRFNNLRKFQISLWDSILYIKRSCYTKHIYIFHQNLDNNSHFDSYMRRYLNRYEKIKSCFCSYRPFFFFYLWTFKTNVSLPESSWFWPLTEGVTVWGPGSALPTRVLKKKIKKNLEHNPVYPVFCENG